MAIERGLLGPTELRQAPTEEDLIELLKRSGAFLPEHSAGLLGPTELRASPFGGGEGRSAGTSGALLQSVLEPLIEGERGSAQRESFAQHGPPIGYNPEFYEPPITSPEGNVTLQVRRSTRQTPRVNTLRELQKVVKALQGAPEEMKATILRNLTGLPTRTPQEVALKNALTRAVFGQALKAPETAERLRLRKEEVEFKRDTSRQMMEIRNTQAASQTLRGMNNVLTAMSSVPIGSSQYKELAKLYLEQAKLYKQISGIDLSSEGSSRASEGSSRAGVIRPSGNRMTAPTQPKGSSLATLRQMLEAAGAREITEAPAEAPAEEE